MDLFDRAPKPKAAVPVAPTPTVPAADDLEHRCRVCGRWAGFGFDVSMRYGRPGRWGCGVHREQVERMAA